MNWMWVGLGLALLVAAGAVAWCVYLHLSLRPRIRNLENQTTWDAFLEMGYTGTDKTQPLLNLKLPKDHNGGGLAVGTTQPPREGFMVSVGGKTTTTDPPTPENQGIGGIYVNNGWTGPEAPPLRIDTQGHEVMRVNPRGDIKCASVTVRQNVENLNTVELGEVVRDGQRLSVCVETAGQNAGGKAQFAFLNTATADWQAP